MVVYMDKSLGSVPLKDSKNTSDITVPAIYHFPWLDICVFGPYALIQYGCSIPVSSQNARLTYMCGRTVCLLLGLLGYYLIYYTLP